MILLPSLSEKSYNVTISSTSLVYEHADYSLVHVKAWRESLMQKDVMSGTVLYITGRKGSLR